MAVANLPKIQSTITGDGITTSNKILQFELGEKIEYTYYIKSTDGALVVDVSKIDLMQTMMFYSDDAFTLNLAVDVSLTEVPDIVTLPILVDGLFRLDPQAEFVSRIDSISIETTSTTNILVEVNIYGAVVA
jgi:hypothetical protein